MYSTSLSSSSSPLPVVLPTMSSPSSSFQQQQQQQQQQQNHHQQWNKRRFDEEKIQNVIGMGCYNNNNNNNYINYSTFGGGGGGGGLGNLNVSTENLPSSLLSSCGGGGGGGSTLFCNFGGGGGGGCGGKSGGLGGGGGGGGGDVYSGNHHGSTTNPWKRPRNHPTNDNDDDDDDDDDDNRDKNYNSNNNKTYSSLAKQQQQHHQENQQKSNGANKGNENIKKDDDDNNTANLAKELYELSVEEREKVLDDIHGVGQVKEESPEFIKQCIQALDEYLVTSRHTLVRQVLFLRPSLEAPYDPNSNKNNYNNNQFDNYTNGLSFKLMFLRTDNYDARKAYRRMCNYFEEKCDLFGEENLVKRITIHDLTREDILVSRLLFVLPNNDRSGRPVLFSDPSHFDLGQYGPKNISRWFWYLSMSVVLDNEDAQKRGVSNINYARNKVTKMFSSDNNFRIMSELMKKNGYLSTEVLPMRITSYHLCHGNRMVNFIFHAIQVGMGKATRLRLRSHSGSDIENEYSLMSFGIKCNGVLQSARNDTITLHKEYVQRCFQLDDLHIKQQQGYKTQQMGTVPYPNPNDVLIGRGKSYQVYSGNIIWRQMIDDKFNDYHAISSSRSEKAVVSMNIVQQVLDNHGRFLERSITNHGWNIIHDTSVAKEKTSICFRSRARLLQQLQQQQQPQK